MHQLRAMTSTISYRYHFVAASPQAADMAYYKTPKEVYPKGADITMSSYIRMLHASTDIHPIDIYVNDNCITKGLSYCGFTDYLPVKDHCNVRVCPAGKKSISYVHTAVKMPGRAVYTLAVVRREKGYELVPISDRPPYLHRGRANIKFVNLSHNVHGCDACLHDGTMLFRNVPFKGVTKYTTLHPGTYTLQIRHNGTGSTVLHVPNQSLSKAKAYTAYAVGMNGGNPPLQLLTPLDGGSYLQSDVSAADQVTLDSRQADVNGDSVMDKVVLIGNKPDPSSPFTDNISVCVEDGKTGQTICADPPFDGGYNASLFLGDFTYDNTPDILVRTESGGSGGYMYAFIYTLKDDRLDEAFDSDGFNAGNQYDAVFRDNYKVEVTRAGTGKKFTIDLSSRKDDYSDIYDQNGRLLKPVAGGVLGLGRLDPVEIDNGGRYELIAYQRIIGRYNADTLGYMKTTLRWDGSKFVQAGANLVTSWQGDL
jgi:hypothetical protein